MTLLYTATATAYNKYSRHLPAGAASEVEAEFTIWKQYWENVTEKKLVP